jgi:hypothetical protein
MYNNSPQPHIIRQSQIKIAMEFLKDKNIDVSLLELVTLTESLTDYISNGTCKETIDRVRKVDEWLKTK